MILQTSITFSIKRLKYGRQTRAKRKSFGYFLESMNSLSHMLYRLTCQSRWMIQDMQVSTTPLRYKFYYDLSYLHKKCYPPLSDNTVIHFNHNSSGHCCDAKWESILFDGGAILHNSSS